MYERKRVWRNKEAKIFIPVKEGRVKKEQKGEQVWHKWTKGEDSYQCADWSTTNIPDNHDSDKQVKLNGNRFDQKS